MLIPKRLRSKSGGNQPEEYVQMERTAAGKREMCGGRAALLFTQAAPYHPSRSRGPPRLVHPLSASQPRVLLSSFRSHAMRAATRIFASNLNPKMAQRFYALVLLPTVRDDINANKRLNYHYYMALKKALYKPAAFFKVSCAASSRPHMSPPLR